MLGNEMDAEFIRDWFLLIQKHDRDRTRAPEGFKYLGAGCYRVAYLHESTSVVYKVECRYGSDYNQSNREEYLNLRSMMLRKLPKEIRFPRYHLWGLDGKTVAAMEYLPKLLDQFARETGGRRYWDARAKLCRAFPDLWDAHGGNIAVDESTQQIVPIDLGGYYRDGLMEEYW